MAALPVLVTILQLFVEARRVKIDLTHSTCDLGYRPRLIGIADVRYRQPKAIVFRKSRGSLRVVKGRSTIADSKMQRSHENPVFYYGLDVLCSPVK
jgi:hypothetical protein